MKTFLMYVYPIGMVIYGVPMLYVFTIAYKEAMKKLNEKKASQAERIINDLAWVIGYAWMIVLWPYYSLQAILKLGSKGGDNLDDSSQS